MNYKFYSYQDNQSIKYYKRNQANYNRISQIPSLIRLIDSLEIIHQKNNIIVISKFNFEAYLPSQQQKSHFNKRISKLI